MKLGTAQAGLKLASAATPLPWPKETPQLSPAELRLMDEAVRVGQPVGGSDAFGFLPGRWLSTHSRQIITTPPTLADHMVAPR